MVEATKVDSSTASQAMNIIMEMVEERIPGIVGQWKWTKTTAYHYVYVNITNGCVNNPNPSVIGQIVKTLRDPEIQEWINGFNIIVGKVFRERKFVDHPGNHEFRLEWFFNH